jgi:hypothetical protein
MKGTASNTAREGEGIGKGLSADKKIQARTLVHTSVDLMSKMK